LLRTISLKEMAAAPNNTRRSGNGDTAKNPGLDNSEIDDQPTAYNPASLEASDAKIASDFGISQSQLSPALISQYSQEVAARSGGTWGQTVMPLLGDVAWGAATGGIGAGIGAALAPALGAIGGAAAGAGVAGAGSSALRAYGSGTNIGSAALHGGISGAVGGALSAGLGKVASGALQDTTGLNSTAANALSKAGLSAAGAAITGGNPLQSGIAGGIGSLASAGLSAAGAPGGASNFLGNSIGKVAGSVLTPTSTPSNSSLPSYLGAGALGAGSILSQGNNGSMATAPQSSTDSSLASTITGALPGVLQSAAGVYGAQNAAQAQTNADTNAINTQQSTLGNINNIWSTQQQLGQGAQTALGSALGTNGQPANYSNFTNMPGYQFAVQQGTQAIQRQAAAMGNAYTPNTAAAVGQYVTGTASQDYNTYISQLMGAAGLGSTANTGIATPTYQSGANISTLQQNQGQAQASGVSGAAKSIGSLFGVNGAGTGLIGAGGSALTGGGTSSDPFAGTNLSNNQTSFNSYDQANGPTASDISNNTSGIGNINVGPGSADYFLGDGT
jgi:hypothetical protein